MKQILLLIILLYSIVFNVNAQTVQWAYTQDVCLSNNFGGTSAPAICSDGVDLISAGEISNSIKFGNQTFTGNNRRNGYLAKHDPNGNLKWARHLVGNLGYLKATTDSNKNIFLVGTYRDSLHIGSLIFNNPGTSGGIFIVKFDPAGNLLWARKSNPAGNGFAFNLTLTTDGNGNVYTSGSYMYTFSAGTTTLTSLGVDDVFLLKFDTNGNQQWLLNLGAAGADRDPSIIGGLTNDVYLVYSSRMAGYVPAPGPNGYYLKKFNNTGVEQWSKFVSRRLVYYPPFLSRDASENVYMAASQDTLLVFGNHTVNYTGSIPKAFLAKVNSSGNWLWAKQLPNSLASESFNFMASEKKNELNIFRNNFSFSTNSQSILFEKIDTSGTIIKTHTFTTGMPATTVQTDFYYLKFVASDNAGNTYLSGAVAGNNSLGPVILNAPPAILGSSFANPSASFIARILENANTVTGTLFLDANGNGVKDSNEQGFENGMVEFTPGPGYTTSAANGAYSLFLPAGNFNLRVVQPANHYTFSPQNHSVSFTGSGQTQNKEFALIPIPNRNDVKVSVTNLTAARPGFNLKYRLTFENVGTTVLSDSLALKYAANQLTYINTNTAPILQQTGKVHWFYQNLQPREKRNIDIEFVLAPTAPIGSNLLAFAIIKPILTDAITENNYDTLRHVVTGSFDPNDKQVSHRNLSPAQVASNQLLDYVIRFQNTGTDTAFTVIVRDSISNKLYMPSFELLSASHPYTFRLLENGMGEWRFDNILLPDSNRNEPASHGFIRYRVQPKTTLVLGDEIKARAAIYFDFNAPVMTNYALTRIGNPLSIKGPKANILPFQLYPNPAQNYVMVAAALKKPAPATIRLVNMLGQKISEVTLPANNQLHYQMPLNNLPKGVYLVQLETETGRQTQRLVIQ